MPIDIKNMFWENLNHLIGEYVEKHKMDDQDEYYDFPERCISDLRQECLDKIFAIFRKILNL